MKSVIVKSSELGDRFDAGFHVVRKELEERTKVLQAKLTDEQAVSVLSQMPLEFKAGLGPLVRGSSPLNTVTAARVEKEYPHLALAIVERDAPVVRARMKARLDEMQAAIDGLDTVSALGDSPFSKVLDGAPALPNLDKPSEAYFQTGFIYPLKDPNRYDDEAPGGHRGYDHIWISDEVGPHSTFTRAGWPVDPNGRKHPDFDHPVAIRRESVDMAAGELFMLPAPKGPGGR